MTLGFVEKLPNNDTELQIVCRAGSFQSEENFSGSPSFVSKNLRKVVRKEVELLVHEAEDSPFRKVLQCTARVGPSLLEFLTRKPVSEHELMFFYARTREAAK